MKTDFDPLIEQAIRATGERARRHRLNCILALSQRNELPLKGIEGLAGRF